MHIVMDLLSGNIQQKSLNDTNNMPILTTETYGSKEDFIANVHVMYRGK